MIPADLKYTNEHEWLKVEGDTALIGITEHAVEELGEIVYVDLPEVGREILQMTEFGSIESVKTVSNLYMPVSGTVIEINSNLSENTELVNNSPYEDGWLVKINISDAKECDDLLSAEEYEAQLTID